MSDFWERKRQALYPQRHAPVNLKPVYKDMPWWAANPAQPSPVQQSIQQNESTIDGHDISKAQILRGDAEECPNCPRDPRTGIRGNMYRPSKSAALRCFDCGYIDGRYFGEGQSRLATVEGKSQHAKQTESGGGSGSNFQGGIRSPDDPRIVGRIT